MDSFVKGLEDEEEQDSSEEETEDISARRAIDAPVAELYLPSLPKHFRRPILVHREPSEFHKAKDDCLRCIHNALLQSQWQRAAELMVSYLELLESTNWARQREGSEEIWKIGTEIMQQHPESSVQEASHFADRMKNLGVIKYLKVSLEHAFHLLCNGFLEEAYQDLSLAESWRYGELSLAQEKERKLIQGYRGLLDYYKWLKKRTDMLEHDEDSYARTSVQQEVDRLYQQAKDCLKEIIKIPGVWDPFVTCYVDMLEHYEEFEEARETLHEYAYNSKFPSNPNAHVFFYQFLKRRGEPKKAQISALQILHELVPSHELMLEFYTMLSKSDKNKHHKKCLKVIFSVLDFAGWKENVKAWHCLAKQIVEILQNPDKQLDWLRKEWSARKDWWPSFHFSLHLAKQNWQENEDLVYEKTLVAGILLGKDSKYSKYIIQQSNKARKKNIKPLKKFLKEHSWVSLRLSDV
uniref:HHIP like 2 n=1 Tax=Anolis carolinensis TaxID=28377 RepID=G1KAE3_ANOCA|nr:PREDICTED: TATA box-binding protein-associated factor RNA polymerase I subunit A [Anolis carolinensis]|eukprot:XP_003216044.1 PREDICTED: TATA box-binding protein-associated factor RNA polymerase I subunit A [Anolis carolinensis]